ncbi:NAD(P)H-dependent flavin oxidoreductase [Rhizobium tubonense]|uniref:Nitronate monooxygenase n=1 Tax=Rhizobium tubonense TaxID=484088 RepID=A0A2W4DKM6_9HYPH|nr:nitronate monooxygenase [Rhizobium tubonense]PZM16714.1 2-nitropropane dioxygenase [Rhizobium tubonense]
MSVWPDTKITDLFGINIPLVQAPMAGATTPEMVIAVSEAGGLGSLATAQYSVEQLRDALRLIRSGTGRPINLNFFAHTTPPDDPDRQTSWRSYLSRYYLEAGLDADAAVTAAGRAPFDESFLSVLEEFRPEVVSFHFGLPKTNLLERVRNTGAKIISSATTVAEARWLADRGVDAIIAMGLEAGGHRGNFLTHDMATQVGTMALVPQIVDAVDVPVIAAGGIADGRGIAAAFMLGASAAQIGTAYLFTTEARIPDVHRAALATARDDNTAITNVFTGRPARGIVNRIMLEAGHLSDLVPPFPTAGAALSPLRAHHEANGRGDFTNLWAGQAAKLARPMTASELTKDLARTALQRLGHGGRPMPDNGAQGDLF